MGQCGFSYCLFTIETFLFWPISALGYIQINSGTPANTPYGETLGPTMTVMDMSATVFLFKYQMSLKCHHVPHCLFHLCGLLFMERVKMLILVAVHPYAALLQL